MRKVLLSDGVIMKNIKISKKIIIIILGAIILLVIGWWILCIVIYKNYFNKRCESYGPTMFRVEDFNSLQCTEYTFTSDKGQKLAGYLYSVGDNQHGTVIISHGFGAGHNFYMNCAYYFAKNGYYVFAYDSTGCDKSEGKGVGGAPQGLIDLDYAISFVQANDDIPKLPIVLFGHSWGGYSVCAVLKLHPEVCGVISISGINSSSDMVEAGGKSEVGGAIYAMMPFVKLYERLAFGKYACITAMDGFEASDAKVMIIHSEDDQVIGTEYGFDKYYEKYKDDSRFAFIKYTDRGHNDILNDPANTYEDEINAEFRDWVNTLDYDYNKDKDRFRKDKAEYIAEHLDRFEWSNRLDKELFSRFLDFFDGAVK